ncbi:MULTISPECIES: WD40/YVTN/BNR-like repeat-containing protein [Kribbella]|uniref:Exo-alpha-sialidase n=1 Tax=Kribbella sancticallisti TaxID=460087 RepID=A0ABN2EFG8_9ACTN|nr:hypothetical protein [Kribbella catacumbae]
MGKQTSAARSLTIEPTGPGRGFFPLLAVLLTVGVVVAGGALWRVRGDDPATGPAAVAAGQPRVGGDLHAVMVDGDRRFVSGHAGAAYSDGAGAWTAVRGLDGKDAMAWASVAGRIFVGGHEGLYISTDKGVTFAAAPVDLPMTDVHSLGGSASTIYLASPQAGLFVSTDAGKTFTQRSVVGRSFMGTILVDPVNSNHAIAPDMGGDVVETRDGGRNWLSLGGPRGAMSVAWDPRDHARMAAVGADGLRTSTDAGRSWKKISAPAGTVAAAFDGQGRLLAATLSADLARLHASGDSGATWTPA